MCKTIKRCFDEKLTFEKLIEAHNRAKKGKTNKKELLRYEIDLETNIMNLLVQLKSGTYKMGKYREFIVHEPKERIIKALPYRDRIVHQWYVEEFIKPYIVPRFIKDTYACVDGRGTHLSIKTLQGYMRKMEKEYGKYYIVKCDISKYFYSIDKNILYAIMKKYIRDKKLLKLTYLFIYDNKEKIGIPIGNYTSQFFANIYLNELDHYVKDVLHIKYYVRYMDDFIFLAKDKKEAKEILQLAKVFLSDKMHLTLNKKSEYFPNQKGINFCGYIIHENYSKVRKRSIKKIKKKVKTWNRQYLEGTLDYHHFLLCFNSFKGHIKHADTYHLLMSIEEKIIFVEKVDNQLLYKNKV